MSVLTFCPLATDKRTTLHFLTNSSKSKVSPETDLFSFVVFIKESKSELSLGLGLFSQVPCIVSPP